MGSDDVLLTIDELLLTYRQKMYEEIRESNMTFAKWLETRESMRTLNDWAIMQDDVWDAHGIDMPDLIEGCGYGTLH